MRKLFAVLFAVTALQYAASETRDQRHVQSKVDTIKKYLTNSGIAIGAITNDQKDAQTAGEDFYNDIEESLEHINKALKDNTRNNEQGKRLNEVLNQAKQFGEWADANLRSKNDKLRENLLKGVEKCSKLIKDVSAAFPNLKDSTQNTELAINSLADAIDNTLFLAIKFFYHLEFSKKFTNSDLRKNIGEVLAEDLASLEKIATGGYNVNELIIHADQLNYLVNELAGRLKNWADHADPKQSALKVIVEKSVSALNKIAQEIKDEADPKIPFEDLKNYYKIWLRGVASNVGKLEAVPKDQSDDIVRSALFDAVGIIMNFKSIFGNLA